MELQKFTKLYANRYFLLIILFFGLVILLLPNILRDSPFIIGEESFYHLRIAKDILKQGIVNYDELSFSGRNNFMELGLGYSIALFSFITKLSVENSAMWLFLILGLVSLYLLYSIFKMLELEESMMTLPVLILSPPFIYLFTVINRYAIPLVLTLLIAYFLLKKRIYISIICFLLMPFFSYQFSILVLLASFLYLLYAKKKKLLLFVSLLAILIFLLILNDFNFSFISDFGGNLGLGVFGVFIVLIGLGFFWKRKRFIGLYFICLLLFLLYLKFYWIIFLLNILLCLLIAFSLLNLLKIEWESRLVRDLTVLLLVCGLLFSGVSFVKSLSDSMPNEELFEALNVIPDNSIVLSSIDKGHWISYAGKKNVIDSFTNFKNYKERESDINTLFKTKDLKTAISILDKYNVNFILINEQMKHELFWEDEGILYLLRYSNNFEKVYEKNNIEIWAYRK